MGQFFKNLSLAPRSIRHKLGVVFALISLIPMLVCSFFIAYYIIPTVHTYWDIFLILMITFFLILLGCYLARQIIYPIVQIAAHAKGIAEGNLDGQLQIKAEDELGDLSGSLNRLSDRLKENMTELRSYGEKIKQINMEINKKVFALSGLLQIGNLITAAANLDEIFSLIVERLSQLESGSASFLVLREQASGKLCLRAQANITDETKKGIEAMFARGVLSRVFENAHPLVMDAQKRPKAIDGNLTSLFQAKNLAIVPVTSSGKVIGVLGISNNLQQILFTDDEIELIGVFAKQVAVAIENDTLMRKTEELTIKDELTGLYNEKYLRSRLDEEIKRAVSYQRPCSFLILEFTNFREYRELAGEIITEKVLKKIAQTLKESTTDIDKSARFSDHQFALILPEKNKHQAMNVAQNLMKEMDRFNLGEKGLDHTTALVLRVGVSATPIDGTSSIELINKALECVEKAKNDEQKRIVLS